MMATRIGLRRIIVSLKGVETTEIQERETRQDCTAVMTPDERKNTERDGSPNLTMSSKRPERRHHA